MVQLNLVLTASLAVSYLGTAVPGAYASFSDNLFDDYDLETGTFMVNTRPKIVKNPMLDTGVGYNVDYTIRPITKRRRTSSSSGSSSPKSKGSSIFEDNLYQSITPPDHLTPQDEFLDTDIYSNPFDKYFGSSGGSYSGSQRVLTNGGYNSVSNFDSESARLKRVSSGSSSVYSDDNESLDSKSSVNRYDILDDYTGRTLDPGSTFNPYADTSYGDNPYHEDGDVSSLLSDSYLSALNFESMSSLSGISQSQYIMDQLDAAANELKTHMSSTDSIDSEASGASGVSLVAPLNVKTSSDRGSIIGPSGGDDFVDVGSIYDEQDSLAESDTVSILDDIRSSHSIESDHSQNGRLSTIDEEMKDTIQNTGGPHERLGVEEFGNANTPSIHSSVIDDEILIPIIKIDPASDSEGETPLARKSSRRHSTDAGSIASTDYFLISRNRPFDIYKGPEPPWTYENSNFLTVTNDDEVGLVSKAKPWKEPTILNQISDIKQRDDLYMREVVKSIFKVIDKIFPYNIITRKRTKSNIANLAENKGFKSKLRKMRSYERQLNDGYAVQRNKKTKDLKILGNSVDLLVASGESQYFFPPEYSPDSVKVSIPTRYVLLFESMLRKVKATDIIDARLPQKNIKYCEYTYGQTYDSVAGVKVDIPERYCHLVLLKKMLKNMPTLIPSLLVDIYAHPKNDLKPSFFLSFLSKPKIDYLSALGFTLNRISSTKIEIRKMVHILFSNYSIQEKKFFADLLSGYPKTFDTPHTSGLYIPNIMPDPAYIPPLEAYV